MPDDALVVDEICRLLPDEVPTMARRGDLVVPPARALVARAPRLDGTSRDALDDLLTVARRLYPSRAQQRMEPLRPDLLGEELVDRVLGEAYELLGVALGETPVTALRVLTRLGKRRPAAQRWLEQAFVEDLERLAEPAIQVAIETGAPIGQVLAEVLERPAEAGDFVDYDQLRSFEAAVPHPTTALREFAVAVMTQTWAGLAQVPEPRAEDVQVEAARVANNLANRLGDLGRREDALAAAEEAHGLYRALAAARPDAFTPDLAMVLNNLAIC